MPWGVQKCVSQVSPNFLVSIWRFSTQCIYLCNNFKKTAQGGDTLLNNFLGGALYLVVVSRENPIDSALSHIQTLSKKTGQRKSYYLRPLTEPPHIGRKIQKNVQKTKFILKLKKKPKHNFWIFSDFLDQCAGCL